MPLSTPLRTSEQEDVWTTIVSPVCNEAPPKYTLMPSSNHISVPSASPASTRIAAHVQQIHLLKTERVTLTARLKRLEAHFNIIATNRKVVMGENTDLKAKTQSMQVEIDTLKKEKVAWSAERAGSEKKVQESGQGKVTVRSDVGSRGFLRPTLSSSGKKVDVFGDGSVSVGRAAGVKGRASMAGGLQVGPRKVLQPSLAQRRGSVRHPVEVDG